ncbi:branched-chain alpha-keto acid dehydrogenase [Bacillus pseudomycoides]|uniref:gamma-glutamylcyclotransferase family protein n=1 Tax=Bacillus TaxID=1386 RepID=UPI000BECE410|nr:MULTISPECIES: gamma-glutamylcyclotransferase family protein [Bacillus]MCX2824816.1 gamma-glutamylcyclotransferase [Bacillus sp. DHT2]MDR4915449.1 gamma-glutamylcyclotransferase family protein [Bacillus pseudomycoides]PDX99436.1 branched-chain alpha-keto acid dehydrogenase [Bacillus pseudomycoides]PEE05186.1 branched-chain alpha-keto acid dehydrogenase [Bacillus pseudomycoides]PEK82487.1 branched-chain alpha-keto acid dehydrogenase [Bacillus pseudomycoides]
MQYVFVYGTLRKQQANAHYLHEATCIAEEAWTHGKLFDTNQGYPAMILSSDNKVYGEVYEVSDEILKKLDELEEYTGNPEKDLYDRITQTIYFEDRSIGAYVYIAQNDGMLQRLIITGDWASYRN